MKRLQLAGALLRPKKKELDGAIIPPPDCLSAVLKKIEKEERALGSHSVLNKKLVQHCYYCLYTNSRRDS